MWDHGFEEGEAGWRRWAHEGKDRRETVHYTVLCARVFIFNLGIVLPIPKLSYNSFKVGLRGELWVLALPGRGDPMAASNAWFLSVSYAHGILKGRGSGVSRSNQSRM